jgi:hypothetical protein
VSELVDFGAAGVVLLAVGMVMAAWRMCHFPEMAAVFLPLFTASLISSATPDWSFTVLGIMLFALGWVRRSSLIAAA